MANHRYETRSVMKRRKMSKPFPLLSLPSELVISILLRLCITKFKAFRKMKHTCKTIKTMAESDLFYRTIDLTRMIIPWIDKTEVHEFFKTCLDTGNITAVFIRGMTNFFVPSRHVKGLNEIKVAVAADLDVAVYSYSMIRKFFSNEGDSALFGTCHFDRNCASTLRRKLDHLVSWGRPKGIPGWFKPRRDFRELENRPTCGCMAYNRWGGWQRSKNEEELCDRCFWEVQTEFFCVKIADTFTKWPIFSCDWL